MSEVRRRKFDKEFKLEAVRLVVEEGRSVAEVARNLGIHENLLHVWKRRYKEDMSLKNKILILVAILGVFVSYNILQPMGDGFSKLSKNDYSLKTHNISKDNKWSAFRHEKDGRFFIHPGEEKASSGVFTFNKNLQIVLDFSIRNGSKVGDIEFIVKKNEQEFNKAIVTTRQTSQVLIKVKKGDVISIIADKHGRTSSDWGSMQITTKEGSFQLKGLIIPFLWSILFVFLLGKNHALIAINSYLIFSLMVFAEKLNFGTLKFNEILTYTLLTMSMTFIFTFLYQELSYAKRFRVASILSYGCALVLYIIPMLFAVYALNYDTKVTKDILYAVFQTNSNESTEYIFDFISYKWMAFFVFTTAFIGFLLFKQEQKETIKIEKSLLIFVIVIFTTLTLSNIQELRLPKFVFEGVGKYQEELKLFKSVQEKRKSGEIIFTATKKESGETYIVIIGESLNKKNMGIYGYLRDTTPRLSKLNEKEELLIFQNAYSGHTHTVTVLSLSLTEANQINKKSYYESLSIIDVLNQADIDTYWLTNQSLQGAWDNMVSVVAVEADYLVSINHSIGKQTKTQQYDATLIKRVRNILDKKTDKNRVIFVHLMGNHVNYCSRYPMEDYSIYSGALKKGEFGRLADIKGLNKEINCYDNSVIYNDYVVSSILKMLQNENGSNGLIYMSDHADDVIGRLGHNSSTFTYEMTQIPMIAWFSKPYINRYSEKYNNLKNNTTRLFSNDFFYDTLLGIFNISTSRYNSEFDLSSKNYKLDDNHAFTMHGSKLYTDKSNYIWWQKKNTQYLIDTNQSSRVFPHRVNSIGKLKDTWNDGFRSFEVDVRFGDNNTSCFQVGHNDGVMGNSLESFLSSVKCTEIQRVWFDFKNLNINNYKQAIERLEYLDNKFGIKKKFIVESSTTSSFFQELKKSGWHTSYYLPTKKIVKLLKENNTKEMKQLATEIAEQTKVQKLSAVSFDNRLYPFIKKYLEPLITNNIVYHVCYGSDIKKDTFQAELIKNNLYLDKRIKTILVTYKSQFNL